MTTDPAQDQSASPSASVPQHTSLAGTGRVGFCSISFEDYQAAQGLNASAIVHGIKSMLHLHHAIYNKPTETPAMRWGRLSHLIVLEPHRAETDLVVYDGYRRGKEWEQFKLDHAGANIVTEDECLWLSVLAKSVQKNKAVMGLLKDAARELSMFWRLDEIGKCKGRMDAYCPNHIVDLKTTADIGPRKFQQTFATLAYHVRLAWYQIGVRELTGQLLPCYIVAIESNPPHDIVIYEVDAEALAVGRDVATAIAKQYRACRRRRKYPGVCQDVTTLKLPAWMMEGENPIALRSVEQMEASEL